jgi:glycosyltransferase involved in cell wall biosynthesis
MASGTPVITSDTTAVPEVVGDGGLLVDPDDAARIRQAIARILEDRELADSLAKKGLERSKSFSWARTAAGHAAIYRQLASL